MSSPLENREAHELEKGEKRGAEDAGLDKVHSANNWENASLGDNDRHKKFLRLMGAKKKEHHGRFVIGDKSNQHARSDEETSRLNRQLEHQYDSGLNLKLSGAARHHSGLGFSKDDDDQPSSSSAPPPPQKEAGEAQKTESAQTDKDSSKEAGSKPDSTNAEKKDLSKDEPQDLSQNKPQDLSNDEPQDLSKGSTKQESNGKDGAALSQKERFKMSFVKSSK